MRHKMRIEFERQRKERNIVRQGQDIANSRLATLLQIIKIMKTKIEAQDLRLAQFEQQLANVAARIGPAQLHTEHHDTPALEPASTIDFFDDAAEEPLTQPRPDSNLSSPIM